MLHTHSNGRTFNRLPFYVRHRTPVEKTISHQAEGMEFIKISTLICVFNLNIGSRDGEGRTAVVGGRGCFNESIAKFPYMKFYANWRRKPVMVWVAEGQFRKIKIIKIAPRRDWKVLPTSLDVIKLTSSGCSGGRGWRGEIMVFNMNLWQTTGAFFSSSKECLRRI